MELFHSLLLFDEELNVAQSVIIYFKFMSYKTSTCPWNSTPKLVWSRGFSSDFCVTLSSSVAKQCIIYIAIKGLYTLQNVWITSLVKDKIFSEPVTRY